VTHSFSRSLVLITVISTLATTRPACQTNGSKLLPDGPALGGGFDRFIYEGDGITTVTFRFSGLRSRTLGSEIGVSLFPDVLAAGALYLAPDLGAAFNLSGPGFTFLAKGGVSTLVALGGGFAFVPGYHLGGGLIIQVGDRSGVRVDVIRHFYLVESEAEAIWSVGLGFTVLPRRRPSTSPQASAALESQQRHRPPGPLRPGW
jgi:hypothetical protein